MTEQPLHNGQSPLGDALTPAANPNRKKPRSIQGKNGSPGKNGIQEGNGKRTPQNREGSHWESAMKGNAELIALLDKAAENDTPLWDALVRVRALIKSLRASIDQKDRTGSGGLLDVNEEGAIVDIALEQAARAEDHRVEIETAVRGAFIMLKYPEDVGGPPLEVPHG